MTTIEKRRAGNKRCCGRGDGALSGVGKNNSPVLLSERYLMAMPQRALS